MCIKMGYNADIVGVWECRFGDGRIFKSLNIEVDGTGIFRLYHKGQIEWESKFIWTVETKDSDFDKLIVIINGEPIDTLFFISRSLELNKNPCIYAFGCEVLLYFKK